MTSNFVLASKACAGLSLVLVLLAACTGVVQGPPRRDGAASSDSGSGAGSGSGSGSGSGGGSGSASSTGSAGSAAPSSTPATFACDSSVLPPVDRLKKLTSDQYRATLTDLASFALKGDSSKTAQVMNEVQALANFPADVRASVDQDLHGSYRRLDQTLQQGQVDASYDAGAQFGAALVTSARIGVVVGACATDSDAANDDACLTDFIRGFGARVLRRPLSDDEVAFYRGVYASKGIDPAGFADVIAALVGAPQAFYQVESGSTAVAGQPGVYQLSAHEVAARLSYQFLDTMPDETLWQAAEDGSLLSAQTYAAQVDRLLSSPRARQVVANFYTDWLKLSDVKQLDTLKSDARFQAFAGSDLPGPTLRQEMIDDVSGMTDYYTWSEAGTLRDLLTSNLSFAKGSSLAKIYGVPPWDGSSSPPSFGGSRPGFLTRAAFLANTSGDTRPIMKGVFIRRGVLCDTIPPPPPGAGVNPPELSGQLSTRQVVEGLTQVPGSLCSTCHATMINALGFATEGYDALGRTRTTQKLFDDKGKLLGQVPVDTTSVPRVVPGDTSPSAGPADLMSLIVESGKADACLARQYFRFTFARWEDATADGCTLQKISNASREGKLTDVLRSVALASQFQQRRFE